MLNNLFHCIANIRTSRKLKQISENSDMSDIPQKVKMAHGTLPQSKYWYRVNIVTLSRPKYKIG